MYHPCSGAAFLPPGVKGGVFSLCPKNSSLYTTHGGFGNGSQVRRIVTQSLREMRGDAGDAGRNNPRMSWNNGPGRGWNSIPKQDRALTTGQKGSREKIACC
jgi:hypothetical protein